MSKKSDTKGTMSHNVGISCSLTSCMLGNSGPGMLTIFNWSRWLLTLQSSISAIFSMSPILAAAGWRMNQISFWPIFWQVTLFFAFKPCTAWSQLILLNWASLCEFFFPLNLFWYGVWLWILWLCWDSVLWLRLFHWQPSNLRRDSWVCEFTPTFSHLLITQQMGNHQSPQICGAVIAATVNLHELSGLLYSQYPDWHPTIPQMMRFQCLIHMFSNQFKNIHLLPQTICGTFGIHRQQALLLQEFQYFLKNQVRLFFPALNWLIVF